MKNLGDFIVKLSPDARPIIVLTKFDPVQTTDEIATHRLATVRVDHLPYQTMRKSSRSAGKYTFQPLGEPRRVTQGALSCFLDETLTHEGNGS